jgi:hypothetical protein
MLDADNAIRAAENQDDGAGQDDTDNKLEYEILSTPPPQAQAQAQEALRQAMINFPDHEWPGLYILLEGNQNWTYMSCCLIYFLQCCTISYLEDCQILQILNVNISPIAILNNLRTAVSTAEQSSGLPQ